MDRKSESEQRAESRSNLRLSCTQCQHYYITHEASFPYGCHALGFKGKRQPILDVVSASGESCLYFDQKS